MSPRGLKMYMKGIKEERITRPNAISLSSQFRYLFYAESLAIAAQGLSFVLIDVKHGQKLGDRQQVLYLLREF
jgi:hypothetical protein